MSRAEFARSIISHQADSALGHELRESNPDTTDDIPWR
jgi:hypothetical protein